MTQRKEHYKEWGARKRVTGIETGGSGFQGTKFYKIVNGVSEATCLYGTQSTEAGKGSDVNAGAT